MSLATRWKNGVDMTDGQSNLSYRAPPEVHPVGRAFLRLLSGSAPVTWSRSAGCYLRLLGLIYLAAFISLWVQVDGLIGSQGISPVQRYLGEVRTHLGYVPWWPAPTLCWINASDRFLAFQCGAGVVLSILATLGVAQLPVFALLWLFYLSLTVASQQFLGYQWDGLLLESGFLAIFLSPVQWLAWKPRWAQPPIVVMWLQRWLIFRLMFLSGYVKLGSGDPNWRKLTALTYHYWTQPLPTWTSYYASHWPLGFQKFSAVVMFVIELGIPLLMLGPRRFRVVAVVGVISLQLLILGTGNYGFFNLLAMALCVPLLDDSLLPRLWPAHRDVNAPAANQPAFKQPRFGITVAVAAVVVLMTSIQFMRTCGLLNPTPAPLQAVVEILSPLRSMNSYGLFAVMTTERRELIFEGSDDAVRWKEYSFKWKPGDVKKRPQYCVPHLPRLDWQLWFAALDPQGNMPTIEGLVRGILRGSRPVIGLMESDPFAGRPPRYVRVRVYQYRFTTADEGARTGDWWARTDTGLKTEAYTLANVGMGGSGAE